MEELRREISFNIQYKKKVLIWEKMENETKIYSAGPDMCCSRGVVDGGGGEAFRTTQALHTNLKAS